MNMKNINKNNKAYIRADVKTDISEMNKADVYSRLDIYKHAVLSAILTLTGTISITHTLFVCIDMKAQAVLVSMVSVFLSLFLAAFLCFRSFFKKYTRILQAFIVLSAAAAVLFLKEIISGTVYIINSCIQSFKEASGDSIGMIGAEGGFFSENANNAGVAAFFITVLTFLVVSFVVVKLRCLYAAMLTLFPIMLIFIGFNVIPPIYIFILSFIYIFGVGALDRKNELFRTPVIIMVMVLAVSVFCLMVLPPSKYKQPAVFDMIGNLFLEAPGGIGNNSQDAEGENSNGINRSDINGMSKLGEADIITHNNEITCTYTTLPTGSTQYLPNRECLYYRYGSNMWYKKTYEEAADQYNRLMMVTVENDKKLKEYLDGGTGDYDELVRKYVFEIAYQDGFRRVFRYEPDKSLFDKLKSVARGNVEMESENPFQKKSGGKDYNSSLMENVRETYTQIDDESKRAVQMVFGSRKVETVNEIYEYIDYIKKVFSTNYRYTKAPGRIPEGEDFAEYFLLKSKEGYCTYFATGAVLAFRSAGIPARYVEGYAVEDSVIKEGRDVLETDYLYRELTKNKNPDRRINVKEVDVLDSYAHAWAEVFIEGVGWIVVEATPPMMESEEEIHQTETEAESGEAETEETEETQENTQQSITETENTDEQKDETGKYNQKFVNVLCIIMAILLICSIILAAVIQILSSRRKTEKLISCGDPVDLYEYLEKILKNTVYRRPGYMDYEEYARFLEKADPVFKQNNIMLIVDKALAQRFGNGKNTVDEETMAVIRNSVLNIKEFIKSKGRKCK